MSIRKYSSVFVLPVLLIMSTAWSDSRSEDIHPELSGLDLQCAMEFTAEQNAVACKKATKKQRQVVRAGSKKTKQILELCSELTDDSPWCEQIIRPNPQSKATFRCTYGTNMPHRLIHPTESTWAHPISAVQIISELEEDGIQVCEIRNWWRPEPYNKNVGGSPTRHPFATSVDVRFCTKADQNKAFNKLCDLRREERVRALGYYGNPTIHLGFGNERANTWGKSCPSSGFIADLIRKIKKPVQRKVSTTKRNRHL